MPSPVPLITQWATWLRAALYYRENFPAVRTVVNNWTSEGLLVSRAKEAVNVDALVPDLVRINQYQTLTTNVELFEASDCTLTEAYELLKNMHFLDDPSSIQAYIKNRLSNSDLEAVINCANFSIAPTTYTYCCKKLNQPLLLLSDHTQCWANYWENTEILISKMSKNTCCCITINNSCNCIVCCLLKNCRGINMYKYKLYFEKG